MLITELFMHHQQMSMRSAQVMNKRNLSYNFNSLTTSEHRTLSSNSCKETQSTRKDARQSNATTKTAPMKEIDKVLTQ